MAEGKLNGANDAEKLKDLASKTYKAQAVWFLNAFWDDFGEKESERLWIFVQKCAALDLQKKETGNELDEVNAHRFLEQLKETMTVTEMRDNLRSTGAIQGNVRMVPLIHILIFRFKINWHELVNASQGDNRKEIEEAQRKLDEVQAAFKIAEAAAAEAKARLREAEAAESAAKAREAEAKAAEAAAIEGERNAQAKEAESKAKQAEAQAAQNELEAALAELKAQEDAFNNKTNELTSKSEDQSIGLVTRNKAKAELAQHLSSDPLPLRRAKITQEAAVKKADRATQAAAEAAAAAAAAAQAASKARAAAVESSRQATQARSAAEQARHQASVAKAAADEAYEEMGRKLEEAEAYFNEIKNRPGSAKGALFWMDRELHEARPYMPEKKGGYRKAQ